jgi:hypothetical protein
MSFLPASSTSFHPSAFSSPHPLLPKQPTVELPAESMRGSELTSTHVPRHDGEKAIGIRPLRLGCLLCCCGGTLPQGSEGDGRRSSTMCGGGASCCVEKGSLLRDAPIGRSMAQEPPRSPSAVAALSLSAAAELICPCFAPSSSCHAPPPRSPRTTRAVTMEAAARGCREQRQPPPCRPPRTAATTAVTAFALAQGFARAWGRRKRVLAGSPCGAPHRHRFLCRTGILGRCRRVASLCVLGGMRTDGVAVPLRGQVSCRASPGLSVALAGGGWLFLGTREHCLPGAGAAGG